MTDYSMTSSYWQTPLDCGHVPTAPTYFHSTGVPLTTGKATNDTEKTFCYACAALADLEDIAQGKDVSAYVDDTGKLITTWAGVELMRVTYNGTANTGWHGSPIHYIRAVAGNGKRYYGKNGGNGMFIRLRANKGQ